MSSGKNKQQNNPYATYDQSASNLAADGRELEARVLLKSVKRLQALQERWDAVKPEELEETLRSNRNVWMLFIDNAAKENSGMDKPLRQNIISLGAFVCKHSLTVMASPSKDKLDILIEINREIAAGLMTRPSSDADKGAPPPPPSGSQISVEG